MVDMISMFVPAVCGHTLAFRKNLGKEIEARNYNCQMAGADLYMRRDE